MLNLFFLVSVLSVFNFTLTLPSIAGVILTVGMAVDANVIIFERIKEEYRLGKLAAAAVTAGFGKAFWTVMDANITTFIAAIALSQLGSGPIQGFAVTLSVGVVSSMFTALVVSRLIFDFFTETLHVRAAQHRLEAPRAAWPRPAWRPGLDEARHSGSPACASRWRYCRLAADRRPVSVATMLRGGVNLSVDLSGGVVPAVPGRSRGTARSAMAAPALEPELTPPDPLLGRAGLSDPAVDCRTAPLRRRVLGLRRVYPTIGAIADELARHSPASKCRAVRAAGEYARRSSLQAPGFREAGADPGAWLPRSRRKPGSGADRARYARRCQPIS